MKKTTEAKLKIALMKGRQLQVYTTKSYILGDLFVASWVGNTRKARGPTLDKAITVLLSIDKPMEGDRDEFNREEGCDCEVCAG